MEYIVIDNTSSSSSSSRTTTPACTTSTPLDAPLDAETLLLSLKNSTVTKHEIRMITTTTTHVMTFAVSSPPSKQRGVSGYSLFVAFHSVALDTSSSPGSTKVRRDCNARARVYLMVPTSFALTPLPSEEARHEDANYVDALEGSHAAREARLGGE